MAEKRDELIQLLLRNIASNFYKPGEKIPSRNQLARRYNLSYDTVDKALKVLIAKGQLVTKRGSGTFVPSKLKNILPKNGVKTIFSIGRNGYGFESFFNVSNNNVNLQEVEFVNLQEQEAQFYFDRMLASNCGILWHYPSPVSIGLMDALKAANVPMLLFNRNYTGFNCVATDADASLNEGIKWLFSQGSNNTGLIYRPTTFIHPYRSVRIVAAYENIVKLGGIINSNNIYKVADNDFEDFNEQNKTIKELCERIFASKNPPRNLILLDSELATGIVKNAQKMGFNTGVDYFLLTFDYNELLANKKGIGMLNQQLGLCYLHAADYFFNPNIDRNMPFKKFVKAQLVIGKELKA
jgi:hypothetical protein